MKKLIASLLLATFLTGCLLDYSIMDTTAVENRIFSVYCNPDLEHIDNLIACKATHVNLYFYNLYTEGSMELTHASTKKDLTLSNESDREVKTFIEELKIKAPEIKVLMALGGWDVGSPAKENYQEFCEKENSDAFADAIITKLIELGFDGFDFDLEGGDIPNTIDNLADSLSPKLKEKNMLMTAALFSILDRFFSHFSRNSLQKLDFVNVMSYNYMLASSTTTPRNSASLTDFDKEIQYWLNKGLLAENLVMGVPYYSQLWEKSNGTKVSHAQISWNSFYNDYLKEEDNLEYYGDNIEAIYETINAVGNTVYIDCNNIAVMKEKALRAKKLGGIMCWSFSQDLFNEGEIEKSLSWNISEVLFTP